jgi:oxalate decarboxylase
MVRTTVIDPQECCETNDFVSGDVWYFPRGHGHVIETLGEQPCHFILVFDNGYFSEFGTFSITDWIGHAPTSLLAKNFGLPASVFENFPKKEVYFAKGKVRLPSPLRRCRDGSARRVPMSTACFRRSLSKCSVEAWSGASTARNFQSLRP